MKRSRIIQFRAKPPSQTVRETAAAKLRPENAVYRVRGNSVPATFRVFGSVAVIVVLWLAYFAAATADAGTPDEVLERLRANAAGIRTVETEFVQEKHLAIMDRTMTMRGRIFMAKPDRLAWRVDDPIRYVMVMDDKAIRQWDSESGQQTVMELDANPALQVAVGQMRQWFSGDYARLTSEYRITLERDDPVELTFVPLPENPAAGYIERVSVRFTDDERYLAGIMIEEKGSDRTELRFHGTKLNREIPSAAWQLNPTANE